MFPLPPKDKDKISVAIMAKMRPPEVEEDSGEDEALTACAEDILAAIEAKDVKGLVDALKAFDEIHDAHEMEESPEKEASEHKM